MLHIALFFLRVVVVASALLLLYIALFLYEDEKGTLQNRLVGLWVAVDDLQSRALSKFTAFLKVVLSLINFGFDSLLGAKLLSLRSVTTTYCYSVASLLLVTMIGVGLIFHFELEFTLGVLSVAVALMALGTSSLAIKKPRPLRIWAACAVVAATLAFLITVRVTNERFPSWSDDVEFLIAFVGGILCDIGFVALNRTVIRRSSRLNSGLQIISLLLCNMLLGVLYILPIFTFSSSGLSIGGILSFVAATNLFTSISVFAVVLLMLIALLNRVFWPSLSRPIYAIANSGIVGKPTLLLSAAFVLLAWAIPAWQPIILKLKEIK